MSASTKNMERDFTDESIISFIRGYKDPCVTAGEVAEYFGVTNEAANYRLGKLREAGEIVEKRVGASAKVWYLAGYSPPS